MVQRLDICVLRVGLFVLAAISCAGSVRAQPILHRPVDTVLTGQALTLRATLQEDFVTLAQLRLYYRWGDTGPFFRKLMNADAKGTYRGCIPGRQVAQTALQYYLEAVDIRGKRLAAVGSAARPLKVRMALAPAPPGNGVGQACADGVGLRAVTRPLSARRLKHLAFRRRARALEASGKRMRRAGRGMVIGGLIALGTGCGFVGYGLTQGMPFVWVGVSIMGAASLVAIIGTPLWVEGNRRVKRALNRLVQPEARAPVVLPDVERRRLARLLARPLGSPPPLTVLGWRLRF